jgi:hypothetical protein
LSWKREKNKQSASIKVYIFVLDISGLVGFLFYEIPSENEE